MLVKKYFKSFAALFLCAFLFINAKVVMYSVRWALVVCYEKVIPSLFIFLVFSSYVAKNDIRWVFAIPLKWYCKLIKIDDDAASCFLSLSLFSGFAVGAKFLNQLSCEGYSQNALKVLSIAMINNSVSFVAFGVGIGILGNYRLGLMIFLSLSFSSLITAFVFSFFYEYNIVTSKDSSRKLSYDFSQAVREAVEAMLVICGFVIIFYCVCEVILFYIDNLYLQLIFSALSEVTVGCVKAASLFGKNPFLLCCILSILPLSTLVQAKAFAKDAISIKTLLLSRFIHTPISLLILSVFINLFPVSANVYSDNNVVIKGYWNSVSLSSTLFFIALIFIIFLEKNKVFTNSK
ncbi:MAG: hypothetical protein RRX95_04185 [Oscillospiraceae bacterium]